MLKYIRNHNGLTLIEVIVSIAILGIILVPISNMFLWAIRINQQSHRLLTANEIAQRVLEQNLSNTATTTGNEVVTLSTNESVSVNFSVSNNDTTRQLADNSLPAFGLTIDLEQLNDGEMTISDSNGSSASFLTVLDGGTYTLEVSPTGTISVTEDTTNTSHNFTFSTSAGQPVMIGVHTFRSTNVNLSVSNTLDEYVQVYVINNDSSTSNVTVTNRFGRVGIINEASRQNPNSDRNLLKRIIINAQNGNEGTDIETFRLKGGM